MGIGRSVCVSGLLVPLALSCFNRGVPQPYPGLSPAQVAVASALVAAPEWAWGSHSVGLRPDGALVEIVPGRALGMHPEATRGMLPLLTDPVVLGHLMSRLDEACGEEVAWTQGRAGPGERRWWCALEAGARRRRWEGESMGEVLGAALLARWEALRRRAESTRDRLAGRERAPGSSARDRLSGRSAAVEAASPRRASA